MYPDTRKDIGDSGICGNVSWGQTFPVRLRRAASATWADAPSADTYPLIPMVITVGDQKITKVAVRPLITGNA